MKTIPWFFIALTLALPVYAGLEPTPFQPQINKLEAAEKVLTSAYQKLDRTLLNAGSKSKPRALRGKLKSIRNRIRTAERKVDKAIVQLSRKTTAVPVELREAISRVGQLSVRISSRAALGFEVQPDSLIVEAPLDRVKSVAERIADQTKGVLEVLWAKVIPVRFVMVHNCFPELDSCEDHFDWDSTLAAVRGMNEAFAPAEIHFAISSVERYFMYELANEFFPIGTELDYYPVAAEVSLAIDPNAIPGDPPLGIPVSKTADSWIKYFSTLYSDPSELLIWVFGRESLVSREIDHHSVSSYPDGGRFVIISAQNIFTPGRNPELSPYHLAHEVGHFFGLPHPWQLGVTNPSGDGPISWADLWDLSYCTSLFAPEFFGSKDEAVNADCELTPIEYHPCPCGEYNDANKCTCPVSPNCRVDNRDGTGNSEMECTLNDDLFVYYSPYEELKGLSFDLATTDSFPDSFAYGLNVMGYYSRYNAHLWTPGRLSASQIDVVKGHAQSSVPILVNYGVEGLMSLRNRLGEK